ncbi:mechanosensitive ion channel family protein [Dyadobacter psychrotolerans]|uniref:Mechanosensitive ion channel family protein n=1 Tax=Dyadobacter psychrotolerans TaxID=2541721 RepID=A0A4R5DVV7_9BACT|nr:hypothetical protein E0F88_00820 [Dyadobacter psychrotolerans]
MSNLLSWFLKAVPRLGLVILIVIIGILVAGWLTSLFEKKLMKKSKYQLMSSLQAKAIKLILIMYVILLSVHAAGLSGIAWASTATCPCAGDCAGFYV